MENIPTIEELALDFSSKEIGIERRVHAYWELSMLRFHILESETNQSVFDEISFYNEVLGIPVISIDLKNMKSTYRENDLLNTLLEQNKFPKWVWFSGIEALRDTSFAGWLRSHLTVRDIDNLRCVFVGETESDIREVFFDYKAPFYQSTMRLL